MPAQPPERASRAARPIETLAALCAIAALAAGCNAKASAEPGKASEGAHPSSTAGGEGDEAVGAALKAGERQAAIAVETTVVRTGRYVRSLTLPGTFAPRRVVRVAAEIPGLAVEVNGEAGTDVAKDDLLLRLDERLAKAQLAQLQAQIDAADTAVDGARVALGRTEALADSGVVDLATLDNARVAYKQARASRAVAAAARQSAAVQLERHVVRAPIAGRVIARRLELGEMVAPGAPLYEIADLRTMRLVVDAPEAQIASIQEGAAVNVRVPNLGERARTGRVLRVPAMADAQSRTFPVEIEVDNSEGDLLGGMMARAELELGHIDDAVLVPIEAVVDEAGAKGDEVVSVVYLVRGGRAARVVVQTAEMTGAKIRIERGLEGGEALIVVGQRRVVDGDRVEIVRPQVEGLPPAPGGDDDDAVPPPPAAPTPEAAR